MANVSRGAKTPREPNPNPAPFAVDANPNAAGPEANRRWWPTRAKTHYADPRYRKSSTRAWAIYDELPLVRHAHVPLRAFVWSQRSRVSAYDATYVALADVLGVPLVTADVRLARAAAGQADVRLAS